MALRHDNTRNAKIAELVEAELIKRSNLSKKFKYRNDDGSVAVEFRDFIDGAIGDEGKILKIQFSGKEKGIKNTSFDILDCSMFNCDGNACINTSEELNNADDFVCNRIDYFQYLQSKIKLMSEVEESNKASLDDYLDISPLKEFVVDNKNKVDFKIRRVGRIQENYALFLNKLYYDHKGRIAVNTIRNIEHHYRDKLKITILGFEDYQEIENICVYYEKGVKKNYVLKSDLLYSLREEFASIIQLVDDERIYVKTHEAYKLSKNDDALELRMNLPVIHNGGERYTDKLTINKIFKSGSPRGGDFTVNEAGRTLTRNNDITIEELQCGISNNQYSISLNGYCIKVDQ